MKHRLGCLCILMVFLLLLAWMRGTAGAQIGTEYPFRLDIPDSYNSSLWMPLWNTPLTWKGPTGAQIGIAYPFRLDIPNSYNPSLWMTFWNTTLTRIVNNPADRSNNSYYPPFSPVIGSGIPLLYYPWSYLYSPSPKKTKPVQPVFENLSLFKMGPLYALINEPYRYLFIADYTSEGMEVLALGGDMISCSSIFDILLDPIEFLIYANPNDPSDPVVKYWTDLGADPNLFGENDPNMAALFGRESFKVDLNLPVFADPNLRFGGHLAERLIEQGTLQWKVSVQGAVDGQPLQIAPLPTDPYDGMPTYLPANHNAIEAALLYQKPCFPPGAVIALEAALWNSGISLWPNVAALDYKPECFEDLTVTVKVTNGVDSEASTFPMTALDHPAENYAPVPAFDEVELIFYKGEESEYVFQFIDPDCFIFSQAYNLYGEIPTATHVPCNTPGMAPRDDMSCLVWDLRINGLAGIHFHPWLDSYIDTYQYTGVFSWTPQFVRSYDVVVTCSDNRGGTANIEVEILCKSREHTPNYPPVILSSPTGLVRMIADEEFVLSAPDLLVEDPEGDEIYASCNIGTCGKDPEGNFYWKFQSNFPGSYMIEIIFKDTKGGYAVMEFFLDVKPWWVDTS
ncbi:MAG: hypothetical protein ACMUIM_07440 [bacterium]